jgi:hypothetical protein
LAWLGTVPTALAHADDAQVITDPAGYISASYQYQPIPYSRQNLDLALQRGGGQVFEITGDVSNIRRSTQGWRTIVSIDLTTASGDSLRLQIPSEMKVPAVNGDAIRILARLSSASEQYAYLNVLAAVRELDLIASSVGLSDTTQVGTMGWVNGYNPGLENYNQPYLPPTNQPARATPPLSSNPRIESFKRLIAHFNPDLTPQEQDLVARALLTYSTAYGVHPALAVSLIACESSFHPKAVSRTGAQGLGQLMPGTAAGLGVSDSFDPIQNIEGSLRLLRGHLLKYSGLDYSQQLALALACYNAGSGAVEKHGGVPPYSETRNYITKVSNLFSQLYRLGYR